MIDRKPASTMIREQLEHAQGLGDKAGEMIEKKYLIGARKHGGNIKRKLMVPHALEEATDLMVYLLTLEEQWGEMTKIVDDELRTGDESTVYYALKSIQNILTTGNKEGIEEEELEK